MTDTSEKDTLSSDFNTSQTNIQCTSFGSLPGSPDFLEMELQYAPVSDLPKDSVHVTVLSPNQDDRRKSRASRFSSIVIPTYTPRPESHMFMAICGLICCAVPLGLIGLVCSLQVDSTYDNGNSESAEWKSSQAKIFSMAAIIIGMMAFLGGSFYAIFYILVPTIT